MSANDKRMIVAGRAYDAARDQLTHWEGELARVVNADYWPTDDTEAAVMEYPLREIAEARADMDAALEIVRECDQRHT